MTIETQDTEPRIYVPSKAHHLRSLTHVERCAKFGTFSFTPSPLPGNPEHVTIDPAWRAANITQAPHPLRPGSRVALHRLAVEPFAELWQAWRDAGLADRVITFDGAFASRHKRRQSGDASHLSNHAWGTAFDINARTNSLGHEPAQLGQLGCVRELVAIAESRRWAWGGWWHTPDGMHFELAR